METEIETIKKHSDYGEDNVTMCSEIFKGEVDD